MSLGKFHRPLVLQDVDFCFAEKVVSCVAPCLELAPLKCVRFALSLTPPTPLETGHCRDSSVGSGPLPGPALPGHGHSAGLPLPVHEEPGAHDCQLPLGPEQGRARLQAAAAHQPGGQPDSRWVKPVRAHISSVCDQLRNHSSL